MKLLTIEIFIHKIYSRNDVFIEQYYEGFLLDKEYKLGEATGDTEQAVIDELTQWVKDVYCREEKFRIKVLN